MQSWLWPLAQFLAWWLWLAWGIRLVLQVYRRAQLCRSLRRPR
jgi:hypothetical protein